MSEKKETPAASQAVERLKAMREACLAFASDTDCDRQTMDGLSENDKLRMHGHADNSRADADAITEVLAQLASAERASRDSQRELNETLLLTVGPLRYQVASLEAQLDTLRAELGAKSDTDLLQNVPVVDEVVLDLKAQLSALRAEKEEAEKGWDRATYQQQLEAVIDAKLELEAALAAALKEREWQPIETAPKDGTEVLVFDEGAMMVSCWLEDHIGAGWWDNGLINPPPTHWQPLPSPPKVQP